MVRPQNNIQNRGKKIIFAPSLGVSLIRLNICDNVLRENVELGEGEGGDGVGDAKVKQLG